MLSKNQIKLINNLKTKRYRSKHKLFIAEGVKVIKEFLKSDYELEALYTTVDIFSVDAKKYFLIDESELKKVSCLTTPQIALALFKIPTDEFENEGNNGGLKLVLDGVRDPGNLGTIIRLCDWFDVKELVCSSDTVDCYNPKVVQATMGSLARVSIRYQDLETFFKKNTLPVYGAFMDGEPIYTTEVSQDAVIVMGNEAQGISKETSFYVQERISIPQFGDPAVESLNVATASSILLNEFKRLSFIEK
ncbi:MAG: TrmH family RNA methyltransferase [Psychroflexus sp.]